MGRYPLYIYRLHVTSEVISYLQILSVIIPVFGSE